MVEVITIVGVVVVAFVLLAIGGGVGYIFYLSTRAKKLVWDAFVYQRGEGIIPANKKTGQIKLSELKPYTIDTVEAIPKKSGATHYWLQVLKKACPPVTADCVEVWGKRKIVRVLLEEDTCTLLKSGYDVNTAEQIFKPIGAEYITLIKTEMQERKDRIDNTKDILSAVTPFIVVGIAMLGLVCIAYFMSTSAVTISENNIEAAETGSRISTDLTASIEKLLIAEGYLSVNETKREVRQELPPEIPP